ncbi:MAG: hypothetical protein COU66_01430 [Candidatus Pacebacteria bacterium CG10_big_fil_rev_8_21_14_0_10_44_11]|nr:MAG: hypothetical protein COU66_01430 [Candidatus Pacebacteria bacterium CG10_big_fil_rev_8_21_14_0_10_44_11]
MPDFPDNHRKPHNQETLIVTTIIQEKINRLSGIKAIIVDQLIKAKKGCTEQELLNSMNHSPSVRTITEALVELENAEIISHVFSQRLDFIYQINGWPVDGIADPFGRK